MSNTVTIISLSLMTALASVIGFSFVTKISAPSSYNQATIVELTEDELMGAFDKWRKDYSKDYRSIEEHSFRLKNFLKSHEQYKELKKKDLSYEVQLGPFADLTLEEFLVKYTGRGIRNQKPPAESKVVYRHEKYFDSEIVKTEESSLGQAVLQNIDWEFQGKLTRVQDQGQCGSCYAYAAVLAIESFDAIVNNKSPVEYSEQQVVDCSRGYGNYGGGGGYEDRVLNYVKEFGIMKREDYTYTGFHTSRCKYVPTSAVKNIYSAIKCGLIQMQQLI